MLHTIPFFLECPFLKPGIIIFFSLLRYSAHDVFPIKSQCLSFDVMHERAIWEEILKNI